MYLGVARWSQSRWAGDFGQVLSPLASVRPRVLSAAWRGQRSGTTSCSIEQASTNHSASHSQEHVILQVTVKYMLYYKLQSSTCYITSHSQVHVILQVTVKYTLYYKSQSSTCYITSQSQVRVIVQVTVKYESLCKARVNDVLYYKSLSTTVILQITVKYILYYRWLS